VSTSAKEPCLSELALDEYLAGELAAEASEHARLHLDQCDRCTARRAERQADLRAFLERAPTFAEHAAHVQGARGKAFLPARRAVLAAASLLALAAAALLIVRSPRDHDEIRGKGGARIGFYVKRGEDVTRGAASQVVRTGDLLRFVYTAPADAHLALFNLDARAAAVYFPARSERAASIRQGTDVPLDFSVELDASPGVEHVHALFCAESFALEPLRAELEAQKQLTVPQGCTHRVITLHKEAP
jgi:hypothetical protein